jgi:ABC-type branched-subunit amino acid transport system substrate-binding protein
MRRQHRLLTQFIVAIALLAILYAPLAASDYDTRFDAAMQAYQEAHYDQAASAFRNLATSNGHNNRVTVSYFMWAQSLLKQRNYDQVLDVASELIRLYPGSSYIDDAHYVKAEAYFGLEEYVECADELIWVAENGSHEQLQERARDHLRDLSRLRFSDRQRRTLSEHASHAAIQRIILGLTEQTLSDQGLVIGAVLPLSGPDSDMGTAMKQGIEYALKRWKQDTNLPVFLSIHDSRSSAYATAQIARDMLELEQVSMIVCAGSEGIVTACASQASAKQIPCLILNPQTYSLTTLGESVFQLYPDRQTEGEALAKYAVESLGLRTFAILASATDQGKELTNGFIETVKNHGGETLIQEWFYPGSLDFDGQFMRIRDRGWGIMETEKPDTQTVVEEEAPQDSIWAYLQNGEVLKTEKMNGEDSLEVPVTAFDGFLIVPDPGDVNVLAPQYTYYNFDSQLIGSQDWDYQDTFDKNRNYVNGIVYSEDVFWDPDRPFDVEWVSDFRVATGVTPLQDHIRGYDGLTWMLGAIRSAKDTPDKLLRALVRHDQFQGKGGTYHFQDRMNMSVSIVRYDRGIRHLLYP